MNSNMNDLERKNTGINNTSNLTNEQKYAMGLVARCFRENNQPIYTEVEESSDDLDFEVVEK